MAKEKEKPRQKLKKGDRVRLRSLLNERGKVGTLLKWEYHKDTGVFFIDLKPDDGVGYYFMGTKKQFSLEKIDE